MDIPESVMSASGANAMAGALLKSQARQAGHGSGSIPRNGTSPRKRSRSASSPVTAAPTSAAWWTCPRWSSTRRAWSTSPTPRRGSSSAPPTRPSRSRTRSGRRGSTAWWSPPARPGPTSRSSATPCARAGSTSTSSTWPTSASTAPGSTPSRRKRRPRRPRTSSACRWPGPSAWSRCRSSSCRSTRRRWWSAGAWPG